MIRFEVCEDALTCVSRGDSQEKRLLLLLMILMKCEF